MYTCIHYDVTYDDQACSSSLNYQPPLRYTSFHFHEKHCGNSSTSAYAALKNSNPSVITLTLLKLVTATVDFHQKIKATCFITSLLTVMPSHLTSRCPLWAPVCNTAFTCCSSLFTSYATTGSGFWEYKIKRYSKVNGYTMIDFILSWKRPYRIFVQAVSTMLYQIRCSKNSYDYQKSLTVYTCTHFSCTFPH